MKERVTSRVLVAGHMCLDIIPAIPASSCAPDTFFRPGALIPTDDCALAPGGPVSNTGLALERLGVPVELNARLGDDEWGRILASRFTPEQARSLRLMEGIRTSYTVVIAPPGADRMFLHHAGANDTFNAEDLPWNRFADFDLLHLGYPPMMQALYADGGEQLIEIFRRAKDAGLTTSLDMALPDPTSEAGQLDWRGILVRVLPYVDFYLPSIEETAFMLNRDLFDARKHDSQGGDPVHAYGSEDLHTLSSELLEMGAGLVALKCGACGFYIRTSQGERWRRMGRATNEVAPDWYNRELWAPAFHQEHIASAAGSGDSSIAGFLAAFLRGATPEFAVHCANSVGWQNLRSLDALSGVDDWPATVAMAGARGQKRNAVSPSASAWVYDEEQELYRGPADSYDRTREP